MNSNRLLVFDSDAACGGAIAAAATASGYEVARAAATGQFLQYLQLWNPAFILLDISKPEDEGAALFQQLCEARHQALILLMAPLADQGRLHLLNHLGTRHGLSMAGMIFKPLHCTELDRTLADLRNSRHWLSETTLAGALERGEFFLEYQPLNDLRTGHVSSVETLIRWRHPQRGLIRPDVFIPFAESTDAIGPVTRWVASTAIAELGAWARQGFELELAFNLSACNLWDADLAPAILEACGKAEVAPSRITLELTETAAVERPDEAVAALSQLRLSGLKLAIDDFGTGYSSLAQLRRLPFSQIKIDRSLITDCRPSRRAMQIIGTVVELARGMGLHCIAEGVETRSDLDAVVSLGCDKAQGYLISQPLPADRLLPWLAGWPVAAGPRHGEEMLRSILCNKRIKPALEPGAELEQGVDPSGKMATGIREPATPTVLPRPDPRVGWH
jgi:EAL domain-containing protein (putative c-di-GMP-specific phosphodiesterase class I)